MDKEQYSFENLISFMETAHQNLADLSNKLYEMGMNGDIEAIKLYMQTIREHPYYKGPGDDKLLGHN